MDQMMSLFLWFHHTDVPLAQPILDDASSLGLIDEVHIVESNAEKKRVQDLLVRKDVAEMLEESLLQGEGGCVFVCANEQAAITFPHGPFWHQSYPKRQPPTQLRHHKRLPCASNFVLTSA